MAIKRNNVLTCATKCVNLKAVVYMKKPGERPYLVDKMSRTGR